MTALFFAFTFEKNFFMRFEKPVPLKGIARLIGAEIIGENKGDASGINEIHKVEEGDLVFVDHPNIIRSVLTRQQRILSLIKKQVSLHKNPCCLLTNLLKPTSKLLNTSVPFNQL